MEDLEKRIAELSPAKRALLELRLKGDSTAEVLSQTPKPRVNRNSAVVSFAQQRLWFLDQLQENQALYNVPRAMRLSGELNVEALQRALNELVSRHEPFRTHFEMVDGTLRQIISENAEIGLACTNLRSLPADEKEERTKKEIRQEAGLPFDLAHGPVIRAKLLQLDGREHILLLTTHHIVSDAWSAEILFTELGELYNAFASGQPSPLAPLAIQYPDFAEWQREWLQDDVLERQLSYWRSKLEGAAGILELPIDYSRAAARASHGAYKFLTLSKALFDGLVELSRHEGATLFMTLLTAFQILLGRYSDQDDIVVGSPIAGRNRVEIESLIGFFVNTLALRTDLSGNLTFRELLSQVKETAVAAYAHQDVPFEKLVEELQPERDLGRNPLFQVMFQFQNRSHAQPQLNGLEVSKVESFTETAKFDLMLVTYEEDEALKCVIEYNTGLFTEQTIERMLNHYATLLESIVANPAARIASLHLMREAERRQVLVDWNNTEAEFPRERSIHEVFEEQAARGPNDLALLCKGEQLTYGELNVRANRLAHHLRRRGVGPEVRVAICVERSVDMIVGLLGILKAGGAYVPLEPSYPAERISFILADSEARLLLTQHRLKDSLPISCVETICVDDDCQAISRESEENPAVLSSAGNSAHVIYTSGSTGQPKGVVSSHRSSMNRFSWMWLRYPFRDGEVCCQKTSLSFVDSIWEIFGPLLRCVPQVIIPDDEVKDPERLLAALSANKVTRLVLVPSLLRVILENEDEDLARRLANLRYCVCSGEILPVELAKVFREKLPNVSLINLYGSSEVAADVTCYQVQETTTLNSIPIGRPIANTDVYILDSNFQPAPVGANGEICIGGEGLARGYQNRAELTAEKFVPHPFSQQAGERLFRTGDIGRYLPDGNIEYRGRRDHQVKIRGFRIELGEIEANLASHPQVHQAVVLARDDGRSDKQLVAYVAPAGESPPINELRTYLRRKLSEHMVPAAFVIIESLPLTASGKVNRLALPHPTRAQYATREDFVAPRTPTEEMLAGIWSDVLNVEDIGVNDDFFALGGHSLLLVNVASRMRESLQLDLPLRALFEAPTVAALAQRVEVARRSADGNEAVPLVAVPRDGNLPLSFAQQRLWTIDQIEPNSAAYNIPRVLRLQGPLDSIALKRSVDFICARHEVLRTRFINDNGTPALAIAETVAVEIPLLDISGLAAEEREKRVREEAVRETQRPFDLSRAPLFRMALIRVADDEHVLLMIMHHIVSDAWSIGVFMRELVICYNAFASDTSPSLPSLPIQYVDFAAWQRKWMRGAALQKQLDYWRNKLAGAPAVIDLPSDRPRPSIRSFDGARQRFIVSKEIKAKLKTLARGEGATLFMALLTAFQSLLSSLTNEKDIVVGAPSAGRDRPEFEGLIGYFVNTLVFRAEFSDDPSYRESLRRTRETALGGFANQDVPFEKLLEDLKPSRSVQYNPLFQVWFVLQNALVERHELLGMSMRPIDIDFGTTRHDLQLTLWETAEGLEGAFTYSTALFNPETIASVVDQFKSLLSIVVEQPDIRVSALRAAMNVDESKSMKPSENKLSAGRRKAIALAPQILVKESLLQSGRSLPLLLEPAVEGLSLPQWAISNRDFIEHRLRTHGGILFRGFNVQSVEEFQSFMQSLAGDLLEYSYRSTPRSQVSGRIYTSTEYPAHQTIPLHNEMSYTRSWPMMIGFYCVEVALEGGETPIADSRRVFNLIDPEIRDQFVKQNVMYVRNYGDGLDLSWQDVFQTADGAKVEEYCRTAGIEFEWKNENELRTRQVCQAVASHPETNEMVWFNQAHLFHVSSLESPIRESLLASAAGEPPRNAYYGDGSAIEDAVLEKIRRAYAEEAVVFSWQKRDVLLLDNMLAAHGRRPYRGARKIVVGMGQLISGRQSV